MTSDRVGGATVVDHDRLAPWHRLLRSRHADLVIGGCCCLVALGVFLLQGFNGALSRDAAVYVYAGQRVADGSLPYVDLVNRVGPLAHAIPGIGVGAARVIGRDEVVGVRALFMLISVACVGATYLLGRTLFRSRIAGLISAACLLSFQGFIHYATSGPREKTAMMLFLILALLAIVHQRWFTTGLLISLATLVWQPVLPAGLVAATVALLLGVPRASWGRAALRVVGGGAAPVVVAVGLYALAGELRTFLDGFLLINAEYTQQSSPLGELGDTWSRLADGYGLSVGLLVAGLVGLAVLGVMALARPTRAEPAQAALIGTAACALVGIAWTLRAFDNWPDTMVLMPTAAIGVGGVALQLLHRLPRPAVVATTALLCAGAVVMAATFAVDNRNDGLLDQRESVNAVLGAHPDATIFSVEAPTAMVLSEQQNASRFQLYGNGLEDYIDDTWPGGLEGYAAWIEDEAPPLIAVSRIRPWLAPVLEQGYERIGAAPGWSWYLRREDERDP